MSVTLTNTTRRMKVLNLPHATYCAALGRCACSAHPLLEEGKVSPSLTLPAGEAAAGLPEAVLSAPEVDRAVRAGELRVTREAEPSPATEATTTDPGRRPRAEKKTGGE